MCLSFKILNLFGILSVITGPSAPFLYEVASHVKNCHLGDYYYYYYDVVLYLGAILLRKLNYQHLHDAVYELETECFICILLYIEHKVEQL